MKEKYNSFIEIDERKESKDKESIEELAKALKSANLETIIEFLESVQVKHTEIEKRLELTACGGWLSYPENKPIDEKEYLVELENKKTNNKSFGVYEYNKSEWIFLEMDESDCIEPYHLNRNWCIVRFAEIKE